MTSADQQGQNTEIPNMTSRISIHGITHENVIYRASNV
jgi:hypothetical protein